MSPLSKRFISVILVSVLCLHFTFLIIRTSPLEIKHPKISFIAKSYAGSFFHQNWNLFVPAPKAQHYLFIRYNNKGVWTKWKDVLGDCVENNRQNKLRGNETLVLLFSNSLIYVINKIPVSTIYKQSPAFAEFKVLQYELSHYLQLHEKLNEGAKYEVLIYSAEAGHHKTIYVQSLPLIK